MSRPRPLPGPPRRYISVDGWRVAIDGLANDVILGRVLVGDVRVLLHRIDELEAATAGVSGPTAGAT